MSTATPWDALLKAPPMRLAPPSVDDVDAKAGTKLAGLLHELASLRSAPTLTLCVSCDLTPRQVWGLLKAPRQRGQVAFDGQRWSLNTHYAGHQVERAAALLRDLGWTVEPPEGGSH